MRWLILTARYKAIAKLFCISWLSFLVSSCANGDSEAFWDSVVAPDAQLQTSSTSQDTQAFSQTPPCSEAVLAQYPDELPDALCYSGASLLSSARFDNSNQRDDSVDEQTVSGTLLAGETLQTRWMTDQPIPTVQKFYQTFFEQDEWQVTRLPNELNNAGILQAEKGNDRITIRFANFVPQPSSDNNGLIAISKVQSIEYTLNYRTSAVFEWSSSSEVDVIEENAGQLLGANASRHRGVVADTEKETLEALGEKLEPINDNTIRVRTLNDLGIVDLEDIPAEIKDYVEAGLLLETVELDDSTISSADEDDKPRTSSAFRPNEPITRREFARWLVQANNRLYENQPSQQIRLASPISEPAFDDIRATDSDFRIIQGLAESGLLSSKLSSDTETESALFGAEAPLNRETLIAWKTPLDTRTAFPPATVESIQETWGFQDAAKITSSNLRALVADYNNGDRANLRRAFGYTLLFQPQKNVTRAEAAAALWYFGTEEEGISATDLLESQATIDPIEENDAE